MSTISIIIPVFNIEAYLVTCLESVLSQTYRDIEVILIDDESSDTSPTICDEYATKDDRIKVLHKSNGGVSAARNYGIDHAKGKFIMFVDGDDSIDRDAVETLYTLLQQDDSDMAICGIREIDTSGHAITPQNNRILTEVICGHAAIKNMLYQKRIANALHAKLYKQELFIGVRLRDGITIAEDLEVNYRLLLKAKRVALCNAKKYNYLLRPGSAMNSTFVTRRMDGLTMAEGILHDAEQNNHDLLQPARNRLFMEAIFIIARIANSDTSHHQEFLRCKKIIQKLKWYILSDNDSRLNARVFAGISAIGANLLITIFKFKKKLRGYQSDK